jgi:hypothetical protein
MEGREEVNRMTEKLSKSERQQLIQLVVDCEIQRLSTSEALSYIKQKLGVTLSDRHFYRVKRQITEEAGDQLDYLSKTKSAYVANYFERIHEGYRYQRKLWKIFHSEKDHNCQLKCLRNLKEVSVYLAELYALLPSLAGITFSGTTNDNNMYEEHTCDYGYGKHIDG